MSHVAVWLTNYGSERYLARAIQSVLMQDHDDLVLYVIDNHSPGEEVDAIVEKMSGMDDRLHPVRPPEGLAGIPFMRWCWMMLDRLDPKPEYTITIGGHDRWAEKEFLTHLVERADHEKSYRRPPAIVYPDVWQLNFEDEVVGHYNDVLQTAGGIGTAMLPQFVIAGVSSPQLFGLWNEEIRRALPVRHCCSGWDHLIVAQAAMRGMILFDGRAKLFMRAPPKDDDLPKYGLRHLSSEQRNAGDTDFLQQMEWMLHTLDEALTAVPVGPRALYQTLLTASMFDTYYALRGMNLHITQAVEQFNARPEVQQILGASKHIDTMFRKLILPVKP
jgi:glycosyl transferase family 2